MTEPVAWLSLDGGDNDPVRFWRHVLAALDMVRPGIAERVGPLAGPPAPPAYDALVSALAERTEGWAVGLQLAALSLRTQPDVARFVAAFTGSHLGARHNPRVRRVAGR
jgi:ATP/maltotriose-dependent transcriptional regulator MalT